MCEGLKLTIWRQNRPGASLFSFAHAITHAWQPTQVSRLWTKAGANVGLGSLMPVPPQQDFHGTPRRTPYRSRALSKANSPLLHHSATIRCEARHTLVECHNRTER